MTFYNIVTGTLNSICKIFFKINVVGLENIPKEGKIIIAANHKSNWDPVFIAGNIRTRTLVGLAKKELNNNKVIAWFIKKLGVITIDREKPDVTSVKRILKALKNDEALAMFPEGTRIKDLNKFGEAKPGLAMFALKSKCDVIPISIVTSYKLFTPVTIYIDKPISFAEYYNEKLTKDEQYEVAQTVINKIAENYYAISSKKD